MSGTYFKNIDIIRFIAVCGVFLFHLNILPGGFLAVSIFFVLSSFLSWLSASRQKNFSLLKYYQNLFKRIYIPLIIVIFLTLFTIYLMPNFAWLNLKPEVTSILLSYNNFWQIKANLNYFAHEINSPFIHMWYIAILLQFDIIFPFIFLTLKKLGEKFKLLPVIITLGLTIISSYFFIKSSFQNNLMFTYYHTLTRIFPCFLGLFIGSLIPFIKEKILSHKVLNPLLFYVLLGFVIYFFLTTTASSKNWAIVTVIVSLITGILILLAIKNSNQKPNFIIKFLKLMTSISYEIYLVQYPIIYFTQNIHFNFYLKVFLIILITIILSIILKFILNFNHTKKIIRFLQLLGFSCIIISCLVGFYSYVIAKDYTKDLQKLEQELNENALLLEKKQKDYIEQKEKDDLEWQNILIDKQNGREKLPEIVTNLSITGVGDSVMLGAISNLYEKFPNSYFDAKISRTAWVVNDILKSLKKDNILGEVVILNLGANGDCSSDCKKDIMTTLKDKEVFWLNVTNDSEVHINKKLATFAEEYPNLHIIDWENITKNHPEYFVADKIHLTTAGKVAYTETIYNAIYEVYLNKYEQEINDLIANHDKNIKNNITFYGNDLLLNIMPYLIDTYPKALFNVEVNTYDDLKLELENQDKENTLTSKIVICYDNQVNIISKDYIDLASLYPDITFYIINFRDDLFNDQSNIINIKFNSLLSNNPSYLIYDKIHLSSEGNIVLSNLIKETIT